jgi:hypothetical protein
MNSEVADERDIILILISYWPLAWLQRLLTKGAYMLYCTVNRLVVDHDIGDWERMCKLRLWHIWTTIAAFNWKECGKILGLALRAEIRNGDVPKL